MTTFSSETVVDWLKSFFKIILDKKGTKDSQAAVAESVEHPIGE
jgi:hypothetical protein